jgi:SMC interacting uncharacterized protein involved in chromosome segregation
MSEDQISRILSALDALRETVNQQSITIAEIKTELKMRPQCPSPGSCNRLEKDMEVLRDQQAEQSRMHEEASEELRTEIQDIKDLINEVKGAKRMWIFMVCLCTALGSIAAFVMDMILRGSAVAHLFAQ